MRVHVLTLFPRLFENFLEESIVGIARTKGLLEVSLVDFREHSSDRHRSVDDRPFGGGPGMVIRPEPVFAAVEAVLASTGRPEMPKILVTPTGTPFHQEHARWLSQQPEWLVLCGRYEGFDQRIHEGFDWTEISLGDFVLSGGEVPAMALIEASTRLLPGALGDSESAEQDSFSHGLLDHPHYTRPRSFRDRGVPDVLLTGDHAAIAAWRRS
ncbi:MAG TPA: tRNA (guanosine(37)-N1)-methyltransferase TrmD, partial [Planctomycetota bacterium]|nr:tRNA (guanosine(37)-N1)-methyltransferase TrmD [Planctomycetota bacterium]